MKGTDEISFILRPIVHWFLLFIFFKKYCSLGNLVAVVLNFMVLMYKVTACSP